MRVAAGTVCFELGSPPCTGAGLAFSESELSQALEGPVAAALSDDEGTAAIADILTGLAETEFEQEGLRRVLSNPESLDDWRVGEAFAETYLCEHRTCRFPWPDGRDERKCGSSLPGADLVGFGRDSQGHCLALGEVKTSSEVRYPPRTMSGRHGLHGQIEELRECKSARDRLLKYLGHRAQSSSWRPMFEAASRRYLRNPSDVQLYGVLIRDVEPNRKDLRVRIEKLSKGCSSNTRIEMLALYLPQGSIGGIGAGMLSIRQGGGA